MKNILYFQFTKFTLYVVDLLIISLFSYLYIGQKLYDLLFFNIFWITLSAFLSFKKTYKYASILKIISFISKRYMIFLLLTVSYLYIVDLKIENHTLFSFFLLTYFCLIIWRIITQIIIRKYRTISGNNFTSVVIIGSNDSTKRLELFFENNFEHDYKYIGHFTNKEEKNKLGNIEDCFDFMVSNNVEEFFCSVKELSNSQMAELIYFADNNLKTIKFIPDNKYIFSKKIKFENHDLIPILLLSNIPLKKDANKIIKRSFDIVFSLIVILGFLSWFTPLLALLIKLESNGEIFFRQMRYGIDFNLFACYKFRSMKANEESNKVQASKNDMRVTKIGKFIRKTSIDELPQFYNVLFGDMSVVGPRPLLLTHTNDYKNKINKFMIRHRVKPGITGLAQVSGYRGNIEKDVDMYNRVKYDVFYVENWSLFLDLKIIIKTIINVIKGEEKAY